MDEKTGKILNELYAENVQLKAYLSALRSACGIDKNESPDEANRKLTVINHLRLGFIPSHGIDREWNMRESQEAIPFLVENMRVSDLEQMVEIGSMAIATIGAFLKHHPTIKIRRAEKHEEGKKQAEESRKRISESTIRAKAQAREELRGTKAENKAVSQLMKAGMSEDEARKLLGFKA